ncbi:MAG: TonB-dependent receptor plug domain-containing protein, partial [Burkholderiales bacterium]|nr:TonB-dependent receptor plug domain-containing protein [Burkholderiales bacterium]
MNNLLFRKFLVGVAVLVGSSTFMFVPQALAQEGGSDADVEEIIVTGSRIKRAGVDTFYPAVLVDGAELDDGAFTNLADALNQIPSFGVPDAEPFGGQNAFSVGQNFVDFLGLGSQRTLTLVNGRRFVSSNTPSLFGESGGLQVDYNAIPVALIERIETIGVGGAPIYGSDAIAGTINIILK